MKSVGPFLALAAMAVATIVRAVEPTVSNRGYSTDLVAPAHYNIVDAGDGEHTWFCGFPTKLYSRGDTSYDGGVPSAYGDCAASVTPRELNLWMGIGRPLFDSEPSPSPGLYLVTSPRMKEGRVGKPSSPRLLVEGIEISEVATGGNGFVWASGTNVLTVVSADGVEQLRLPLDVDRRSRVQFFPPSTGPWMWFLNNYKGYVGNSENLQQGVTIVGSRADQRPARWVDFIPFGGGQFAWARPFWDDRGRDELYLAAANGELTPLTPLVGYRRISRYTVSPATPSQVWIVIEGERELYRIDVVNGRLIVAQHFTTKDPLGEISTTDGVRFWIWSDDGLKIGHIERKQLVIKKLRGGEVGTVIPLADNRLVMVAFPLGLGLERVYRAEIWDEQGRVGSAKQFYVRSDSINWANFFDRHRRLRRPLWQIGIDPIVSDRAVYEFVPRSPLGRVKLSFGGRTLTSDRPPPATLATGTEFPQFDLSLTDQSGKQITTGNIRLIFRRGNGEDAKPPIDLEAVVQGSLPLSAAVVGDVPYDVVLEYSATDGLAGAVITWHNIRFTKPFLSRKWVRTIAAYLFIVLVGLGLMKLPAPVRLRGWLPSIMIAGSAAAVWMPRLATFVNAPILAGLLVATIIVATAAGMISPPVFRRFARLEPLRSLSGVALLWPPVRKRLLTPYAQLVSQQIRMARRDAHDELYVAIPAIFTTQARSWTEARPAEALVITLGATATTAAHVLIQAAGGRGKSALLNQTIALFLDAFRDNAGAPLPVLCKEPAATIEESVVATLGKFAMSSEIVEAQLSAGKLIVVIDGLTESAFTPLAIGTYLRSETAAAAPLLAASRPNDEFKKEFEAISGILIEPKRLDNDTLHVFEETYLSSESRLAHRPLTEMSRRICRTADGGYLPILVRLAMIAESDVDDMPALYDNVCASLLHKAGEPDRALIDRAAELCTRTYWKDGVRTLSYRRADDATASVLSALLRASIVIPADSFEGSAQGAPSEVRFFHDSMQTYLTARGLAQRDRTEWTGFFLDAAAAPRFREISASPSSIPEIYEMCVHVLGTREATEKLLTRELRRWAHIYREDLPMSAVRAATPKDLSDLLPETSAGPEELLLCAIEVCSKSNDVRRALATLYAGLAPLVIAADASRP